MLISFAVAWVIVECFMFFLWWLGKQIHNYTVVDIGWSFSFLVINIVYLFLGEGYLYRKYFIALLVSLWCFRLGLYLINRMFSHPEDPRYVQFREKYEKEGGSVDRKFLTNIFLFQGTLSVFLSIPFLIYSNDPSPKFSINEFIGFGIWFIGVLGEAVADFQLQKFKLNPQNKSKVCEYGLWNYSRHPNYFFEWLVWVAYSVLCFNSYMGFYSIISPIVMLLFLTKLTGIPMTEKYAIAHKGEEYKNYQKTTSAFIPWFKKG